MLKSAWRIAARYLARRHGFPDPVGLLARIRGFAQPAEVCLPLELLRAGAIFHARGLLNTQAIQHNLHWVWPFWVERQFDPLSASFVPRGFAITHVNLTHRNWTALGNPDSDTYPIVDPAGLLTPFWDSWSLDAWLVAPGKPLLIPSREQNVRQDLDMDEFLAIRTELNRDGFHLSSRAVVNRRDSESHIDWSVHAESESQALLIVTVRPTNPEGVSLVHRLTVREQGQAWIVNDRDRFFFAVSPQSIHLSDYRRGDVLQHLEEPTEALNAADITCPVGLATGAAVYQLDPGSMTSVRVSVPLERDQSARSTRVTSSPSWTDVLASTARLQIPNRRFQFLFDAAVRTLVLLSPGEVYPGPYTYRRFWFRDATFILNALLALNMPERVGRCLSGFRDRQSRTGYFLSQEGEWDSNGQVLWIMARYFRATDQRPDGQTRRSLRKAMRWIRDKRLGNHEDPLCAGLLPAGFSAEHFGPSDFYYWDDFWAIAGLRSAATLFSECGETPVARECLREATDFERAVNRSIEKTVSYQMTQAIPASPYRRMDAGAIGSLVSSYPLRLYQPDDPKIRATVTYLLENCLVDGGFFQDIIHSGINPYLTLQLAQTLLRAGDARFWELVETVARLASSTGQWPEAVHPRTRGGCMGDGQHAWASAEWVLMMRHLFVREEADRLVLLSGIPGDWLKPGTVLAFGPTCSAFGPLTLEVDTSATRVRISLEASWHGVAPLLEVHLPGGRRQELAWQPTAPGRACYEVIR